MASPARIVVASRADLERAINKLRSTPGDAAVLLDFRQRGRGRLDMSRVARLILSSHLTRSGLWLTTPDDAGSRGAGAATPSTSRCDR